MPVEAGQTVVPRPRVVGIVLRFQYASQVSRGIRVPLHRQDISRFVVGIDEACSLRPAVMPYQLVLPVVGILFPKR